MLLHDALPISCNNIRISFERLCKWTWCVCTWAGQLWCGVLMRLLSFGRASFGRCLFRSFFRVQTLSFLEFLFRAMRERTQLFRTPSISEAVYAVSVGLFTYFWTVYTVSFGLRCLFRTVNALSDCLRCLGFSFCSDAVAYLGRSSFGSRLFRMLLLRLFRTLFLLDADALIWTLLLFFGRGWFYFFARGCSS